MSDPCTETREEFERRYALAASTPAELAQRVVFGETHVSMECTCDDGGGPTHWVAIFNDPESINDHLEDEKCLADLRAQDLPADLQLSFDVRRRPSGRIICGHKNQNERN